MKSVVANILSNQIQIWWFIRLFIHFKILPLLQPSFCSLNYGSSEHVRDDVREHPIIWNYQIYENKIQCDWILRTSRNHVLKLRLGYLPFEKNLMNFRIFIVNNHLKFQSTKCLQHQTAVYKDSYKWTSRTLQSKRIKMASRGRFLIGHKVRLPDGHFDRIPHGAE